MTGIDRVRRYRWLLLAASFLAVACSNYAPDRVGADLGQGWRAGDRDYFYFTSQGSRLIRRDWLLALERDDSPELFLADGLARFGYLPGAKTGRNPDGLPVGFAADPPDTRQWIGMNCAACHTSEIAYRGATMLIDGAPASADMFAFLEALKRALRLALKDDATFLRFAARVLGAQGSDADRGKLREELDRFYSGYFEKFVSDSTSEVRWGPARLDAFGMIFNRVASISLRVPGNSEKPNAPVSYPFLWGTSWHDYTQWNGAVHNAGEFERLGRNVGQVLGVFGTVDFTVGPTYPSSVQLDSLAKLEQSIALLTAPVWPEAQLGTPDATRVAAGKDIFSRNCGNCHQLVARDNQQAPIKVRLVPAARVGTDDAMTRMAATRLVQTGMLEGRVKGVNQSELLGPRESAVDILGHAVIRVILHGILSDRKEPEPKHGKLLFHESVVDMNYKARPLNGIWATAPYLHNGSVRTLWQLLQPPNLREARFYVGSREFDPKEVGFVNLPGVIPFELDTSLPGNLKTGHVYGTGLSDEQKWDLIEYLKTL